MTEALIAAARIFRLRPFDTTTPQGRARERYRRALLMAAASLFSKFAMLAANLIAVRLTLRHLGSEKYGVWVTVTSALSLLAFADFGIGSGLVSSVAQAAGKSDTKKVRALVSSAFFSLALLGALAFAAAGVMTALLDWRSILKLNSGVPTAEVSWTVWILILCLSLAVPMAVVQRVQIALQEGFLSELSQALAAGVMLAGVYVAIALEAGLPAFVAAAAGSTALVGMLNTGWYFFSFRPSATPSLQEFEMRSALRLIRTGLMFFFVQAAMTVIVASDNIILSAQVGPKSVTEYAVPARMFSLVSLLTGVVTTPLWSPYADAYARGDVTWMRKTLRQTVLINGFLVVAVAVALAVFGPFILRAWLGREFAAPPKLLMGLAASTIVTTFAHPIGVFLMGINLMRFSVWSTAVLLPANLVVKVVCVREFGIVGLGWATAITYLICVTVPAFVYVRRLLRGFVHDGRGAKTGGK